MNAPVLVHDEPQPPTLAEVGDEMQRTMARSMDWVLREWRAVLAYVETKQTRAVASDERDELAVVRDLTRSAIDSLERSGRGDPARLDHLRPSEYSWYDITHEMRRDSAAGSALWARVRQTARDDLACGAMAGQAVEGYHSRPYERAMFLAIREALADGLQPRNQMELLLIDGMAESWMMHLHWLREHSQKNSLGAVQTERQMRERDEWEPPRLSEAEAVDRAALMADRFHRTFLRTLKAYRDQRRLIASMTVLGGQVNVAEQQVIASAAARSE